VASKPWHWVEWAEAAQQVEDQAERERDRLSRRRKEKGG
jgi:hypothetical protein